MQGDGRTETRPSLSFFHFIFGRPVTGPVYGMRPLLIGQRIDIHPVRHHKSRIEAQTEVADDLVRCILVLVFFKEVRRTGEGHLIDILLHLFCRHADSVIRNLYGFILVVQDHIHARAIALRKGKIPHRIQFLHLCDGITGIRDHLSVKNVMIAV